MKLLPLSPRDMVKSNGRNMAFIASGTILFLMLAAFDCSCGPLSIREMFQAGLLKDIMLSVRVPRVLTAIISGAAMALAGAQMQALFRNPLADPHILGISAGAGTGAAVATVCAASLVLPSGAFLLAAASFIGALLPSLFISAAATKVRSGSTLLLLGVMLGFVFSAVTSLIAYGASQESLKLFHSWTAGSFSGRSYAHVAMMAAALAIGLAIALLNGKGLDVIVFGDDYATLSGANVRRIRSMSIIGSCLMTGAVTAFCGPIGFIGMTAPHLTRMFTGSSVHRRLLPSCMLTGACIALFADVLSQMWTVPVPVGSTVALIAIPVVMFMLTKGNDHA